MGHLQILGRVFVVMSGCFACGYTGGAAMEACLLLVVAIPRTSRPAFWGMLNTSDRRLHTHNMAAVRTTEVLCALPLLFWKECVGTTVS
jgi:hypothetical protein